MTWRHTARAVALGVGGAIVVLALLLVGLWTWQAGRALPNTEIAGVDVSRQQPEQIRASLAPVVDARRNDAVVFSFEEEEYLLSPEDIDFRADLDASVAAVLAHGRDRSLLHDASARLRSLFVTQEIGLHHAWDEQSLQAWVNRLADDIDRDVSPGVVEADPTSLAVRMELPHGAAVVHRDQTRDAALAGMVQPGEVRLPLPVETSPQRVPNEAVERVASQVRRALEAPLILRASGRELVVEPSQIAQMVEMAEVLAAGGDATVELVVTPDRFLDVIGQAAHERFNVSPQRARYVISRVPPRTLDDQGDTSFSPVRADVAVEGGRDGAEVNDEVAATQITELLRDGRREAELRLDTVHSDLSPARAEELKPTHLLGTFTTYFTAGQARSANIQRLADLVDGEVLLPDEQFSINQISGERTCEKGFQEAGMILNGELVDVCGGGVSQFGTTAFNAAFFAGLPLDAWKAHSWYISRYPMGREATLNYPSPDIDVRFTNTTEGAVVVKTSHTASSVTVSIYGKPIASRVVAQHGEPYNHRPYTTENRNTSELRRGQSRVVQAGTDGFTVDVVRIVERLDGTTDRRTITTVYVPQRRIVEHGTAGPAQTSSPSPPPEDGDDPDPVDGDGGGNGQ